jgi:predicted Fe-S protein YdhL (DUF1289 family)
MKARYLMLSAVLFAAPFHAFADDVTLPYEQRQAWWSSLSSEQKQEIVGTAVGKTQAAVQSVDEAWTSLTPEQQQNVINMHETKATGRRQAAESVYQNMTPEQKEALKTHRVNTVQERSVYRQGRRESRRSYMGSE